MLAFTPIPGTAQDSKGDWIDAFPERGGVGLKGAAEVDSALDRLQDLVKRPPG